MWNFLDKIRVLPEDSRNAIAVFYSAVIGLFIIVPWFVLHDNLPSITSENTENQPITELASPFSFVSNSLGGLADDFKDKFNKITDSVGIMIRLKEVHDSGDIGTSTKQIVAGLEATLSGTSSSTPVGSGMQKENNAALAAKAIDTDGIVTDPTEVLKVVPVKTAPKKKVTPPPAPVTEVTPEPVVVTPPPPPPPPPPSTSRTKGSLQCQAWYGEYAYSKIDDGAICACVDGYLMDVPNKKCVLKQ